MKLLKVVAKGFKNCIDNFSIDFIAKSKKTSEDREYELQELAPGLYSYNIMGFVGKNASGKTSVLELLDICYSILGEFRLDYKYLSYDNVELELWFYYKNDIYKYNVTLIDNKINRKILFSNEKIYKKKYYKSKQKDIYSIDDLVELEFKQILPSDTSRLFFVLGGLKTRAVYFDCNGYGVATYSLLFEAIKAYNIDFSILEKIIRIFDQNIKSIEMLDEKHYKMNYRNEIKDYTDTELLQMLSSGTTKGVLLYVYAVAALKHGFNLIIDEIENHFHKTLVENLIALFRNKKINKNQASLIFSTHYLELLDSFNRQDNIWVLKGNDRVEIENMYTEYNIRPELLKSKQYYNDTFNTAVDYDDLMNLKKELL